jgi:hypothetical protein
MEPNSEHAELKSLILENQRLLQENNEILKKMHRSAVRHFWFNIAYIVVFLGLPVIVYYYLLAPYLETFESAMPQSDTLEELKSLLEGAAWRGIEPR